MTDPLEATTLRAEITLHLTAHQAKFAWQAIDARLAEIETVNWQTFTQGVERTGYYVGVAGLVGAPDDWPVYAVPAEYHIRDGVILREVGRKLVVVAGDPILVVGRREDVGAAGEVEVEVGWRDGASWRRRWVPRRSMADARQLVGALAGVGAPVTSSTAAGLVAWLAACEASARRRVPTSAVTTRLGWHDERYVAGPECDGLALLDPEGSRAGWRSAGTWDGWLSALSALGEEPVPWLILASAAAAPLLRWIDPGHCPIVDLSGPRGRGKTTCLRVAGSAWGRPDEGPGGTLRTWDATPTWIERAAATATDCPLLLDDSRRASNPERVGGVLYALAQGRGRGRGTVGGVQSTSTWRTVVVSTGEAPILDATEAGGARARVLSVTSTPPISSRAVALAVERGIDAHHGHAAPRLAAWALEQGDGLREAHREARERWGRSVEDADTRLLSIAACIGLGVDALVGIGVPVPAEAVLSLLESSLKESAAGADQGARALAVVRDDWQRHRAAYWSRSSSKTTPPAPPAGGWHGIDRDDDWIGVIPGVLTELLRDAGHDVAPVLARWAEAGVLVDGDHGRQTETRVNGAKWRVYALSRAAVTG